MWFRCVRGAGGDSIRSGPCPPPLRAAGPRGGSLRRRTVPAGAPPGHSRGVLLRWRGMEDVRAMPVATTRFSGRAFSAREVTLIGEMVRDCSGLSRMELARTVCELLRWRRPNGRLKARECREFSGAARRGGGAGAAGQAPGPRARFGHPRSPDGGRRGGAPARGQRARHRAAGGRAGARARRAPAVPGAGGPLPLPGAQGSLRCPPALSGVCVAAGAGGGWLLAVLEPGVAHGGAGPLGRVGTMRLGRGISSMW